VTDQFNVRLRWGLDRQVRVKAAQLGVKPRDIIEDALEIAGFVKVSESGDPGPNQLRLAMPERADIAPSGGRPHQPAAAGESEAPPRADDRVAPGRRRTNRGRKGSQAGQQGPVARAKAGETGSSGEVGSGGQRPVDAPDQGRGCPECGGELQDAEDVYERGDGKWLKCEDCGYLRRPDE
jgi:hypothetical protein